MKLCIIFYIGSFLVGLTLGAMAMREIMEAGFKQESNRHRPEGRKVQDAKVCANCDEIFTGQACPACGEDNWAWLSDWLQPLSPDEAIVDTVALDRLQRMAGLPA